MFTPLCLGVEKPIGASLLQPQRSLFFITHYHALKSEHKMPKYSRYVLYGGFMGGCM